MGRGSAAMDAPMGPGAVIGNFARHMACHGLATETPRNIYVHRCLCGGE